MELADMRDLGSRVERRTGSNPAASTINIWSDLIMSDEVILYAEQAKSQADMVNSHNQQEKDMYADIYLSNILGLDGPVFFHADKGEYSCIIDTKNSYPLVVEIEDIEYPVDFGTVQNLLIVKYGYDCSSLSNDKFTIRW